MRPVLSLGLVLSARVLSARVLSARVLSARVLSALVLSALVLGGCGGLRRRGTPVEGWPGGQYIGAECNRVMCMQNDARHDCPRDRPAPSVADHVRMAICVPRHVSARHSGGSYHAEERHAFRRPDLVEQHQAFNDHDYTQLEAALLATSIHRNEASDEGTWGIERAYLRAVYAQLVDDEAELLRELDQVATLTPESRAEFMALVRRLREPPHPAGATEAHEYLYYEVPRQVIEARRVEYAAFPELYARLDPLLSRAEAAIAQGQVTHGLVGELEALRAERATDCSAECHLVPLVIEVTRALVRLHVALDARAEAINELNSYYPRPTLAAAIWQAQREALPELERREAEVQELIARGMDERAARTRVPGSGRVRPPPRSLFAVPDERLEAATRLTSL